MRKRTSKKVPSNPRKPLRQNNHPSIKTLIIPPIIAFGITVVLISFGISGTSSGILWQVFQGTEDPRLLSGEPRGIRSDEWLVQQAWVVSQFYNNFPVFNFHFPGGMDMTVFNDLPVVEWSSIFRPHVWGYFFGNLAIGIAWYWWIPALSLFIFVYIFTVTILPSRPIIAVVLALATLSSPFVQWWYQPTTLWSVAWVFALLSALVWMFKTDSMYLKSAWAFIAFYFSVTLALEIYVPFIVPAILIFVICGLGIIFQSASQKSTFFSSFKSVLLTIWPLLLAGIIALGTIALWVFTRISTISSILSTAYPGQRSISSGSAHSDINSRIVNIFSAPWSGTFKTIQSTPFGSNASEASTAFAFPILAIPAVAILIVVLWKRQIKKEWMLISVVVATSLFLFYLYVPNWDLLAKIMGLSLVPTARAKIAFVILLPIFAAFLIQTLEKQKSFKKTWLLALITFFTGVVIYTPLIVALSQKDETWSALDNSWIFSLALFLIGTALIFIIRFAMIASSMLLIATLAVTWGVNPLYQGIYDLNTTNVGKKVSQINSDSSGLWIGVGSWISAAVLTQVPVQSLSGVQTYPISEMWERLDPNKLHEGAWNRLGHTRFEIVSGETIISNPQPDVIAVGIDPCTFRKSVNERVYILSENPIKSNCLSLEESVIEKKIKFWIYKIK